MAGPDSEPSSPEEDFDPLPLEPMAQTPLSMHPETLPLAERPVAESLVCLNCGYLLRGLNHAGQCPECGTPVARSSQGNFLRFSSLEYLRNLNRGINLIVWGIATSIALTLIGVATGFSIVFGGNPGTALIWVDRLASLADVAISTTLLVGWYLFSSPDPAIVNQNTGDRPRQIIRICVVLLALTSLVNVVNTLGGLLGTAATAPTSGDGFLDAVSFGASLARFLAAMLYIGWIARRVPDDSLDETSKRYLWLLPLIFVVGAACLGAGPLLALILYWILLYQTRTAISWCYQKRHDEVQQGLAV